MFNEVAPPTVTIILVQVVEKSQNLIFIQQNELQFVLKFNHDYCFIFFSMNRICFHYIILTVIERFDIYKNHYNFLLFVDFIVSVTLKETDMEEVGKATVYCIYVLPIAAGKNQYYYRCCTDDVIVVTWWFFVM